MATQRRTGNSPSLSERPHRQALGALTLGALGVVYGDIGTSPLYAVKACLGIASGSAALSISIILGIMSLIFWSLLLVVTVKYTVLVMRADNEGEGGILALLAMIRSRMVRYSTRHQMLLVSLGLCGTALLVADGMITPAISVLSAVEGLEVATPFFKPWIMPLSMAVIVGLFMVQRHGAARIGKVFGPIMIVWFAVLAALGLPWILREPTILQALNPWYAVVLFRDHGMASLLVLGGVVLCVTGCEALYADMGHFGRKSIVLAWNTIVFPSILINYLGQGAYLIHASRQPDIELAGVSPFFEMAPAWLLYPLVALATAAAVIASQALISGMFSLMRQAIQMEFFPRTLIVHTSSTVEGQIYIPLVNAFLGVSCVALIVAFRDSESLAAAYGIAVVGAMAVTSVLMYEIETLFWGWNKARAAVVTLFFLTLDGCFLAGNVVKILYGGWFPIAVGIAAFAVFTTWNCGLRIVRKQYLSGLPFIEEFENQISVETIHRIRGTGVFLMSEPDVVPRSLLHHLKHYKVLHENVILIHVIVEGVPSVPAQRHIRVLCLSHGFVRVNVYCGFMQLPRMQAILAHVREAGVPVSTDISYCLGHMTAVQCGRTKLPRWQAVLFAFLMRFERSDTMFADIPSNQAVELGERVEL